MMVEEEDEIMGPEGDSTPHFFSILLLRYPIATR